MDDETALQVTGRTLFNEFGGDAGWTLAVCDSRGHLVDDVVVRRRAGEATSDEEAVLSALASRYDVGDIEIVRGIEEDDDGLEHRTLNVTGLKKR